MKKLLLTSVIAAKKKGKHQRAVKSRRFVLNHCDTLNANAIQMASQFTLLSPRTAKRRTPQLPLNRSCGNPATPCGF